jgi:hypothetical protein
LLTPELAIAPRRQMRALLFSNSSMRLENIAYPSQSGTGLRFGRDQRADMDIVILRVKV